MPQPLANILANSLSGRTALAIEAIDVIDIGYLLLGFCLGFWIARTIYRGERR
jgi:hypothetical protein